MATELTDATSIRFELRGIAEVLETKQLTVPVYQRSYSWKHDEQVAEFWADLDHAFKGTSEYFLGTAVLAMEAGDQRTVIDGQQRLATTSLLFAAIRNELSKRGSEKAGIVERDYLARETLTSEGKDPRLSLNTEDDSYFRSIVAHGQLPEPSLRSHQLLSAAFWFLSEKISSLADAAGSESVDRLLAWVRFLQTRARLGIVEVPTEADAYVIFETLNDRGADLTTADLLKNFLYGRAGTKLDVVREHWVRSLGALELTTADAKFTAFLRHYWSSRYGATRERELYKAIKRRIDNQAKAVALAEEIAAAANVYAALTNPQHEVWAGLGEGVRDDVTILARFNLAPNRPLLLAAVDHFEPNELRKLLRALVSWSVRGMVLETMNSGSTEERYCGAAVKIRAGTLASTADVRTELGSVVPNDADFKNAFSIARVTKSYTARYYLCALERAKNKNPEPELVPNEDETKVNLEHVLPRNARTVEWPTFPTEEDVDGWAHRLGNMVLLQRGSNSRLGNKPFEEKRPVLAGSALKLTADVATVSEWSPAAVEARQARLAELAVHAWPR